ncbi:MAG: hypothetical protein WCS70_05050 [Verrucomicrobiota bacterium]
MKSSTATTHSLLPSLTHWLWLLIFVVLISPAWRTVMVSADGDTLMHWRVGEWMLEHRQIVATDTFSHTHTGEPVITKEWLAEILFALAGRAGGLFGQACLAAFVIATTFALLHRQLLRAGNDLLAATAVTLLAAFAANIHWLARPHVFSFLFVLLWNVELLRFNRTRQGGRLLVILTGLMLFWVNLHGGFLVGFVLLGTYWLGAALERDGAKLRVLTVTGLVCGLASLANPNGYQLHWHNLEFLRSSYLTSWLAEYASTNFHSLGALTFVFWIAAFFFTLALARPQLTLTAGLILLTWFYFALTAARNIPLLALVTAPILAAAWSDCARGRWRDISNRVNAMGQTSRAGPLVLGAAVVIVAVIPKSVELSPKDWPIKAVEFIQAHPAQFTGNMFNQYKWGGYALWYLPEHKTFVDGRTDFFGEPGIREFSQVTDLRAGWAEPLTNRNVQWVMMPADHRLNLALDLLTNEWRSAYSDSVARVWSKLE